MWAPILELNKENIVESLDEYIMNLNSFKNLLQNDKFGQLKTQMTQTNYIKNILKGIR
jgi:prephenate dehydrogenase